jgi:hypothetical protein
MITQLMAFAAFPTQSPTVTRYRARVMAGIIARGFCRYRARCFPLTGKNTGKRQLISSEVADIA